MNYTEHSSILGAPAITPVRVAEHILARPHGEYTAHDVRSIVREYALQAGAVGLDPCLAIAQMLHETGNLTSFWAARPQRNPAGIGVNGEKRAKAPASRDGWAFNTQRRVWERGVSFASWDKDAIPAHLGRLLAYALPKGAESDVQAEAIERALQYRSLPLAMRGSAPTLRQLGRAHNPTGQGWASPGTVYGARIAALANHIAT
jgi:hypothetical protein